MKFTSFKHFCREFKGVPIYALYPESFCVKNLATRKVFAFSDSASMQGGVCSLHHTSNFLDLSNSIDSDKK